jgi:hypothetical protein
MKKKNVIFAIAAVMVLAAAAVAYAGVVGHVSVNVNTTTPNAVSSISNLQSGLGIGAINEPFHTTPVGLTDSHYSDALGQYFSSHTGIHVVSLGHLTHSSGGGHYAVAVDHSHFSGYTAANIKFYLLHHDYSDATELTFDSATSGVGTGTYAFVSDDGLTRSAVPTATNKNLVFHAADGGDHDHSSPPAPSGGVSFAGNADNNVQVHPVFARGTGGDDGGGGGCGVGTTAPFALLLIAGAGAALKFSKKSGD